MYEINKRVIDIIEDLSIMNVNDVSLSLADDLALDSLKMVMLLIMIEEEFEIQFDETDLNPKNIITVEDVIELVLMYLEEKTDTTKISVE